MNNNQLITSSSLQGRGETWDMERAYIKENLQLFIVKDGEYSKHQFSNGWLIKPSFQTEVRTLAMNYILEHFSLWELYRSFHSAPSVINLKEDNIRKARAKAIDLINDDSSLSPDEKKNWKRKIWDTPLIIYGLIMELVYRSEIFWDALNEETVYPEHLL